MNLEDALELLNSTLETILTPLTLPGEPLEEGGDPVDPLIKELIFGPKVRGTPEVPHLKVIYGPITPNLVTMGSIGNREAWDLELKLGAVVKEGGDPVTGQLKAVKILSAARDLILADRTLGIRPLVRTVESTGIEIVPYPFGKKQTLYGAGHRFKIALILK